MTDEFKNKRIFVTGGTGSIGWGIVLELLKQKPKEVIVYSRDENKQYDRLFELGDGFPVRFVIGDIRDKERMNEAMFGSDVVFHTAAMKHVPICEHYPYEAIKTNVIGTQNVIDCAFFNNVEKMVGISTDKAAHATNVLGSTKFLSEKMMRATITNNGKSTTKFCFVRFGNVLGSRGSVVPLFKEQAESGGPITITEPEMTRFFMSIPQAVQLIFKASQLTIDREIFILKMPVIKLKDLATSVIEGVQDSLKTKKEIPIKILGKRAGERMHEILLSTIESLNALETKDMFILLPEDRHSSIDKVKKLYPGATKTKQGAYESQNQPLLSVNDIKNILF